MADKRAIVWGAAVGGLLIAGIGVALAASGGDAKKAHVVEGPDKPYIEKVDPTVTLPGPTTTIITSRTVTIDDEAGDVTDCDDVSSSMEGPRADIAGASMTKTASGAVAIMVETTEDTPWSPHHDASGVGTDDWQLSIRIGDKEFTMSPTGTAESGFTLDTSQPAGQSGVAWTARVVDGRRIEVSFPEGLAVDGSDVRVSVRHDFKVSRFTPNPEDEVEQYSACDTVYLPLID